MFKLISMKRCQNEWRGVVRTEDRKLWDWRPWVKTAPTHTDHTFYLEKGVWCNEKTGYTASSPMSRFLDAKLRLEKRFRDNQPQREIR